jgi:hypothetical protein
LRAAAAAVKPRKVCGNPFDIGRVGFMVAARPQCRQVGEGGFASQTLHSRCHTRLDEAGSPGNRLDDLGSRIHEHMLQMGTHASLEILESLAGLAGDRRANPGKVVVARSDGAGLSLGRAECQKVRLDEHLKECNVPSDAIAPSFDLLDAPTYAAINAANRPKPRIDFSRRIKVAVSIPDECHQCCGLDAARHLVAVT